MEWPSAWRVEETIRAPRALSDKAWTCSRRISRRRREIDGPLCLRIVGGCGRHGNLESRPAPGFRDGWNTAETEEGRSHHRSGRPVQQLALPIAWCPAARRGPASASARSAFRQPPAMKSATAVECSGAAQGFARRSSHLSAAVRGSSLVRGGHVSSVTEGSFCRGPHRP